MIRFLLSLLLIFGVAASHAEQFVVDGIEYAVLTDEKTPAVAVVAKNGGYAGNISIPAEVCYNDTLYGVVAISPKAFSGCYRMKSITLPDGLKTIGDYAFAGCLELKNFRVPTTVDTIGENILYECNLLKRLEYDATDIKFFGSFSRGNQYSAMHLDTLIIGENVERLPQGFIMGCEGLAKVVLPSSVKEIGLQAFMACRDLKEISVAADNPFFSADDGVLFNHNKKVLLIYPAAHGRTYKIPKGVEEIAVLAFAFSYSLEEVQLSSTMRAILGGAFSNCVNLKKVKMDKKLDFIGPEAFANCRSLRDMNLPKKISFIGERAFLGTSFNR